MFLTTARLYIRPFTTDDVPQAHSLFSCAQVMQPVGLAPALTTPAQTLERLALWQGDRRHHAVTLRSGPLIGYLVVNPDYETFRRDTLELGFALHPQAQHCGYMSEAVTAVLDALYPGHCRYVRACCFRGNRASSALMERCGFSFQRTGACILPGEGHPCDTLEYRIDLKKRARQRKKQQEKPA